MVKFKAGDEVICVDPWRTDQGGVRAVIVEGGEETYMKDDGWVRVRWPNGDTTVNRSFRFEFVGGPW